MAEQNETIDSLFEGKDPTVRAIYDRIVEELAQIGPFTEDVRQDSIHLAHSVTFASIHPQQDHLILTLRTDVPIVDTRVERSEHVSESRWQIEIGLTDPTGVDDQVRVWLSAAMMLT